jgi:hypothetical protein
LPIFSQDNFDDVEPDQNVWIIQQLQPGQRAPRNQFAFRSIDRFKGPSKIFSSARFNFDEDESVAIATNDIDFTAMPRPEITVKNSVAFAPEKGTGQFFPARTEPQMFR